MCDAPQPWHDELFYYVLRRELDHMQKGKPWKWAEVRCGMVVSSIRRPRARLRDDLPCEKLGFVPHVNPNNFAAVYANFLSLYRFMYETGHPAASSKAVAFPASPVSYHNLSTDCNQDIFARFSIHLCLHPERAGNSELYNIGDSAKGISLADRWPFICSLFGLEGKDPVDKSDPTFVLCSSFIAEHADEVERLRQEKGVNLQPVTWAKVSEYWMDTFSFDTEQCLDKARATGFSEELTVEESWRTVLDRYVKAKKMYFGET